MTDDTELIQRIEERIRVEVASAKGYVRAEERAYQRTMGALMTLRSLLDAGAIHPNEETTLREWLDRGFGGLGALDIVGDDGRRYRIIPPSMDS